MKLTNLTKAIILLACASNFLVSCVSRETVDPYTIVQLTPAGNDFVNPDGKKVRLWGTNLVSFYPEHPVAEKTAANLASLGYNCVRPHHMLRQSKDWNPNMVSGALMMYKGKEGSRAMDPMAWDRFDYLNACLRQKGIYLAIAIHNSRCYHPEDYKILDKGEEDNMAWKKAVKEIGRWHWKKSHDVWKMLPMFDERAALINEEFTRLLLNHVNPYTNRKYGSDPQVVTLEVINEFSVDYAVICKNKFPEYFHKNLEKQWHAYQAKHNVPKCDFYAPKTKEQIKCRSNFMVAAQERYFNRIEKIAQECGYKGAIAFSNLFHGEVPMQMKDRLSTYIEDHAYVDPRITRQKTDFFQGKFQTRMADKPYIIGEMNFVEWGKDRDIKRRERAMLPLVCAAYGAFNDWAGLIWFSWNHGGRAVGLDGWAKKVTREAKLGDMIADSMMLDHMRTAGLIFRQELVKPSINPKTVYLDGDFSTADYHELVRGVYKYKPGWQAVHAIRKKYGKVPDGDKTKELLAKEPPSVLIADTGELVKDTVKGHLTLQSPYAAAFAGNLKSPDKLDLKHLAYSDTDCFATIAMVSNDKKSLAEAGKFILSRTVLNKDGKDIDTGILTLKGLKSTSGTVYITRPRSEKGKTIQVTAGADGSITFPVKGWHECELVLK